MTIDLDHPSTLVSTKTTRIMKSEKRVECPKEGPVYAATRGGNVEDLRDMARMGKRFVQTTYLLINQKSKNKKEKRKDEKRKMVFFVVLSKRLTDVCACEKQSRVTAKFQIGHHVWLLCHSHVLVGVPPKQLEHRLDERWNRWPDLDLGACLVGFHGCIPFHGRGTTLTRHAMIPLSLHFC